MAVSGRVRDVKTSSSNSWKPVILNSAFGMNREGRKGAKNRQLKMKLGFSFSHPKGGGSNFCKVFISWTFQCRFKGYHHLRKGACLTETLKTRPQGASQHQLFTLICVRKITHVPFSSAVSSCMVPRSFAARSRRLLIPIPPPV